MGAQLFVFTLKRIFCEQDQKISSENFE